MQTHYDILGLPVTATPAEIKAAFRRLAKLYHPDKNPQGKEQFERVLVAYEVLIDPQRKKQYDLRIKYNSSSGSSSSTSASQAYQRKQSTWNEEELKRRQYYQEHYKTHYQKSKAQPPPQIKKSYNEYKYILFATPLAVALLMFIITIYDKEPPLPKQQTQSAETKKETKAPDSPYGAYFKNPVYDTAANVTVLVNNFSSEEVIIALFDHSGKFLRSCYIKPDYYAEISQLPDTDITVKMLLGKHWNYLQEHKEANVLGGFEKTFGYFETRTGKQERWTVTINTTTLSAFEKISEKEFFKKSI